MAVDPTSQPPSEANIPEKPAPAQVNNNTARNHQSMQPVQFQPMDVPKPEPFRPSKPYSVGKLTLSTFNFVFAVIVLGLSIGILIIQLYDIVLLIISGVMALSSILWQLADYTTICVRRSIYRAIHPGAHVAIHLILWVLALLVTISACFALSYELTAWTVDPQCANGALSYTTDSSTGERVYCDEYYTFSTDGQARLYMGMLEAVTVFSALMLVCHFALFVMACIETDRRRKWGKQTRVVYMVATSGGAMDGRTYYTQVPPPQSGPMVQQQQQQQQQQSTGPNSEMYGYYAPPTQAASAAAHHHSGENGHLQEGTAGASTASYA
ncbi:hypothetical protein N0V82_001335 [Gnomoniopsis sp. IMI 355080]|nr:hypothetical protein N0V82_001335 [Gnomoniopsis sp. IMI 355080]